MLNTALRELRRHPGRYLATLIAVAISIGFMSAASIVTSTEKVAIAHQELLPYGKADLVLTVGYTGESASSTPQITTAKVLDVVNSVPGVAAVSPVYSKATALRGSAGSARIKLAGALPELLVSNPLHAGRWPSAAHEIVVSKASAAELGVGVGDKLQSVFADEEWLVTGLSGDPKSFSGAVGYVVNTYFRDLNGSGYGAYALKLTNTTETDAVRTALTAALTAVEPTLNSIFGTFSELASSAVASATGDIDALKYVLWVFVAIAVVVGMITISNTFTILLAGRRRQIGLLRAIGADGAQVRRSVLLEAMIVGFVGALVGIGVAAALATVVGVYTGSIRWGIVLPWAELGIAVLLSMIMTVVAAFLPAARHTAVSPMDALRPVDPVAVQRRVGTIRKIICALLLIGGAVLVWCALHAATSALPLALLAAVLLAFGVLFAAPLFVPLLLRCIGAVVGRFTVVSRLAVANTVRNPARAAATATALMLAVGLVFTLQIGSASMRETVLAKMSEMFPVDLAAVNFGSGTDVSKTPVAVSEQARVKLEKLPNVSAVVPVSCAHTEITANNGTVPVRVCGYDAAVASTVAVSPADSPGNELWVSSHYSNMFPVGSQVSLLGDSGQRVTLTVREMYVSDEGRWFVSPEVLQQLGGVVDGAAVLMRVTDHSKALEVYDAITDITKEHQLNVSGGLMKSVQLEQMLQIIVMVLTGLLAIAVLIALVGVGNTLTLSVIERTRESALLRALGLQGAELKLMLAIEAVLLVLTGTIVGLAAGAFFGWLGTKAMVTTLLSSGMSLNTVFAIDWPVTLGLLGVLLLAALLASLFPGRRAAKATVVEALSDLG